MNLNVTSHCWASVCVYTSCWCLNFDVNLTFDTMFVKEMWREIVLDCRGVLEVLRLCAVCWWLVEFTEVKELVSDTDTSDVQHHVESRSFTAPPVVDRWSWAQCVSGVFSFPQRPLENIRNSLQTGRFKKNPHKNYCVISVFFFTPHIEENKHVSLQNPFSVQRLKELSLHEMQAEICKFCI